MAGQKVFGYARVSTKEQKLDRQLDALICWGVAKECVFADHASGGNFARTEWCRLMDALDVDDVVVVTSIDRLGRNYDEIIEVWRHLTKEKGVHIVVLDMPILDTREKPGDITGTFLADLFLQLLSYVAQVERENIRRRQAEGIASAHTRGVKFGRPKISRPADYEQLKSRYLRGDITRKAAAANAGVSVTTFSNWLRADDEAACAVDKA